MATEVRFYHLMRKTLDQALPSLLEKCLERGWRAVVTVGSAERVKHLNTLLWTYDDTSFLPHGAEADGDAAEHPIWLTDRDETPNGATVLFLVDGAERSDVTAFDLVCTLFDGRDEAAVLQARAFWKTCRGAGCALTYWQQGEQGGWVQKQKVEAGA